jgi:RNA 2',3'-cyclic 3'-phosphodiesterase
MIGDRPLSIMIKPLEGGALEIDHQRRVRRIDRGYSISRLHSTVLPLWDDRDMSSALSRLLDQALASLQADPFPVVFDTLKDNALVGVQAARGLRAFRKTLVRHLVGFGIPVPTYKSRPHISLAYGLPAKRRIAIPPIGWQVEEFLLIRSIHGEGRHEELGRWPLIARQGSLPF